MLCGCKDIRYLLFMSESFFYSNNNNKYSSSNSNNGTGNRSFGMIDSSGVREACSNNTGIVKVMVQIVYVMSVFFLFFYNILFLFLCLTIFFWMVVRGTVGHGQSALLILWYLCGGWFQ